MAQGSLILFVVVNLDGNECDCAFFRCGFCLDGVAGDNKCAGRPGHVINTDIAGGLI